MSFLAFHRLSKKMKGGCLVVSGVSGVLGVLGVFGVFGVAHFASWETVDSPSRLVAGRLSVALRSAGGHHSGHLLVTWTS